MTCDAGAICDVEDERGFVAVDRRLSGTVVVGLSAVVAALATGVAMAKGPGLASDSTFYLSAGLNLARGNGYRFYSDGSVTVFPPGLPLVVALGQWLGGGVNWTFRCFHACTFSLAVWLGYLLLRRHVRSVGLALGATVLISVSPPLLLVEKMALSEPAFIVISLAFILILERLIDAKRIMPLILAAAVLVWVGFLFRYAAISLIPVGAIALAVGRRHLGWRHALADASGFSAFAAAAPLLLMARNYRVDGTFMGPRPPSSDSPGEVARGFSLVIGKWVTPSPTPERLQTVVGVVALIAAATMAVYLVRRRGTGLTDRGTGASFVPLACFLGVYSIYLFASELSTAINPIDNRLMSPLYVPLVVAGAMALDRLADGMTRQGRLWVLHLAKILLIVFVLAQAAVFVRETRVAAIGGTSYSKGSWQSSPLGAAARELPAEAEIYSNLPDGLWAIIRREPILPSPARGVYRSTETRSISSAFVTAVACRDSFLVWFTRNIPDYVYTPEELKPYVLLEVVSEWPDGTVYRLRPSSAEGSSPC